MICYDLEDLACHLLVAGWERLPKAYRGEWAEG